jgi:hypothetical protein
MAMPRSRLLILILVFLGSRIALVCTPQADSTVNHFLLIGFEMRYAAATGRSVYELHRSSQEQIFRQHAPEQPMTQEIRQGFELEYPPLANWLMTFPTYFATGWGQGNWQVGNVHLDSAARGFRLLMGVTDLATFALLTHFLLRARGRVSELGLWTYVLGGLSLHHVLYERYDLLMGALLLAVLAILVAKRHWMFAITALAVAIHVKVVPILVAPAVLLATIRTTWQPPGVFLRGLAVRGLGLAGVTVALLLPFWLKDGPQTLAFLKYHSDRGLQVESVPATVALLFSPPSTATIYRTHGADDVMSPITPLLGQLASGILLAWVLGSTVWLARRSPNGNPCLSLLVVLWGTMVAAKVFSPQYLLWLVPVVPLVVGTFPHRRPAILLAGSLLVMGVLTSMIHRLTFLPGGLAVSAVRNGLFIATFGWLVFQLWKNPQAFSVPNKLSSP